MEPGYHRTGPVFEHPLTPTVSSLLHLEELAATLDTAQAEASPEECHHAATRLAAELSVLSPRRLGASLVQEIRRWTSFLDRLATREGVDRAKLARLRNLLERLERHLAAEWSDYFDRLSRDPWLVAYRRHRDHSGEGFQPGPGAWSVLGSAGSAERLARWTRDLGPIRTATETGLRLMRDSLQTEAITCHPEGYELALPAEPASGLVRVTGPAHRIPELVPRGQGLRLRFLDPEELTPVPEAVAATLGRFVL